MKCTLQLDYIGTMNTCHWGIISVIDVSALLSVRRRMRCCAGRTEARFMASSAVILGPAIKRLPCLAPHPDLMVKPHLPPSGALLTLDGMSRKTQPQGTVWHGLRGTPGLTLQPSLGVLAILSGANRTELGAHGGQAVRCCSTARPRKKVELPIAGP